MAWVKKTIQIMKEESSVAFQDLEKSARRILDQSPQTQTIIFGHTHRPIDKIYADGKQYINTGTWTKMIYLDWKGLGQRFQRTFAYIHIHDGRAHCQLRQWVGEPSPHQMFQP